MNHLNITDLILPKKKYEALSELPCTWLNIKCYKKPLTFTDYHGVPIKKVWRYLTLNAPKQFYVSRTGTHINNPGWCSGNGQYDLAELSTLCKDLGLVLDHAAHIIYLPQGVVISTAGNVYGRENICFAGKRKDNPSCLLKSFTAQCEFSKFRNVRLLEV